MTDFVKIGEKEYPVKWNTRAKVNWEKKCGLALSDLAPKKVGNKIIPGMTMTTEMSMQLCYEALKQGHRLERKVFALSIDDIYDLNDDYDLDALFGPVIFPPAKEDSEKKTKAGKA